MNTAIIESSVARGPISSAQELIDEYLCHNEAPEPGREITKQEVDHLLHKISQSLGTAEMEQWQFDIAKILESYKQQFGWKVNCRLYLVMTMPSKSMSVCDSVDRGYVETAWSDGCVLLSCCSWHLRQS